MADQVSKVTKFGHYSLHDVPVLFGIGLVLFLIAYATNSFFQSIAMRVPIVRPSVGFGLGMLLIFGTRFWPAIFAGALLVRLTFGFSLFSATSNAIGLSIGCVVGCWLLKRDRRFDLSLPSLHDYFRLLIWAAVLGAGATAIIATVAMVGGEAINEQQRQANLILKWWMGDTLGVILITPLLLAWRLAPRQWLQFPQFVEAAIFFVLSFLVGQTVFLNWFHDTLGSIARGYWLFLFVVWGGARLGSQSVTVVLLMTMIQALIGAAGGVGFFGTDIAQTQLLNFWFYMVILSLVGMGLASTVMAFINAEKTVRDLAQHDALTGIANRRLLSERLDQSIALAKRHGNSLALIFHDLDNFKPVNDSYGHGTGDLLLQNVVARVQECVRETDTVARLGGDEFVILLPSIAHRNDVLVVAEKIHDALLRPFIVGGHTVNISTSIGIAIYPEHGETGEQLLVNADNAMYSAKMNGRNNIQFFSAEMSTARHAVEGRR